MEMIKRLWKDDSGNATEYGLIIALVSIAIIAGAGILGDGLKSLFTAVGNKVQSAADSGF